MQPQHDYSQVNHHEHHDDDSSTEVESLVGAEKQWAANDFRRTSQRSKRRTCLSIWAALRWVLVITLQFVIIGLLAREQGFLSSTRWGARSTSASDPGGDITGWSPHSTSP
jgi:hypothetical protein